MTGATGDIVVDDPKLPWMEIAKRYEAKKVHELRGGEDPDIVRFFKEISHPEMNEDEIPWCAAFVGACLYEANMGHDGSAWAADYAKWEGGDPVAKGEEQYGDIAVLTRNGGGHVTFFVKDNGNGTFKNLGGNQSDMVCYSVSRYSQLTAFRRPNGKGTPKLTKEDAAIAEKAGGLTATEVAVGVAGGATALTTTDWITGLVVVAIIVAIGGFIWWKRRQAADPTPQTPAK